MENVDLQFWRSKTIRRIVLQTKTGRAENESKTKFENLQGRGQLQPLCHRLRLDNRGKFSHKLCHPIKRRKARFLGASLIEPRGSRD